MVDLATLHDRDFYAWTLQQANLLREGRLSEADIDQWFGQFLGGFQVYDR